MVTFWLLPMAVADQQQLTYYGLDQIGEGHFPPGA